MLGALRGEEQPQMFEDASVAASPAGQQQGMAFLESLMGGQQEAQGMVSGLLGGGKVGAQGGPDLSMLTSMLDADGDGSILDDVMGKFMR